MPSGQKLNFIFINTDQQRYDTLGCTGNKIIRTPNIDKLAQEGFLFNRCYTTNPVCMPARAAWFTGQYNSVNGVWMNGVPLDPEKENLQKTLTHNGYHTTLIGKIHLDNVWLRNEKHPLYGFDELIECEGDPYCKDEYFQWLDSQNLFEDYMEQFKAGGHTKGYVRKIPLEKHMNNWITNHVDEYLSERSSSDKPFFLSVGFFDPHHPFDPCEPYASMYRKDDMPMPHFSESEGEAMVPHAREKRKSDIIFCTDPAKIQQTIAAYYATISHVDDCVGKIMAFLKKHKLEKNTVVIFTSDHGELLGDHGMLHKGAFFYENSVKVPLIWRFPEEKKKTGVINDFISHIDFAPTICKLAGIPEPDYMQGRPLFCEEGNYQNKHSRDYALVEWRDRHWEDTEGEFFTAKCLIVDGWKIVCYPGKDFGELYDLANDPDEFTNLWCEKDYSDRKNELKDKLIHVLTENEACPKRTDCF